MRSWSFFRNSLIVAAVAAFAAGCSAGVPAGDQDDVETTEADDAALTAALPAPAVAGQRLYFGSQQGAYLSDESPLSAWTFSAKARNEFKVSVAAIDENGNHDTTKAVGFKLYYLAKVNGRSTWKLLRTVDGPQGSAVMTYVPPAQRTYLLTAAAGSFPTSVQIGLGCRGDSQLACAVAQQPGDFCGGIAASRFKCDEGLFCQFPAETCGAADQGGVCTKPSPICPRHWAPVCGCDGKTYGNACMATSASVSVASEGECCVETKWTPLSFEIDHSVLAANGWANGPTRTATFFLTLNEDGTFSSHEEPLCTRQVPRCMVKIAPRNGTFTHVGQNLVLSFEDGETSSLAIQGNCKQDIRFVGRVAGKRMTVIKVPNN